MAATAIGITAISGTPAVHFHGPEKPSLYTDIKPESDENPINPNSEGVILVAVLQTEEFDPTSENVNYRFGARDVVKNGGGARLVHSGHVKDVDGDADLLLHFLTANAGFNGDEDEGHLHWERGQKGAHHGLDGSDTVTIVDRGQH